jgi:hypothetical protein
MAADPDRSAMEVARTARTAATSTEELPLVADAELVEHGCGGTYHRYGSGVIVDLEKELDDGRLSTGRSEDDR